MPDGAGNPPATTAQGNESRVVGRGAALVLLLDVLTLLLLSEAPTGFVLDGAPAAALGRRR